MVGEEKRLSGGQTYKGIVVNVHVDEVLLPDGSTSKREMVMHPGGVGVIPVDEQGMVSMVRQFRYVTGGPLLEIPAGKREGEEDPALCAVRELAEETGYHAGRMIPLGFIWASPGISAERLWLYLALDLTAGSQHLDEEEFLDVERYPLAELAQMAADGRLTDGKTAIGILRAKAWLDAHGE